MNNENNNTINEEGVPGITETIPAGQAEEMGAFEETALTETEALDADTTTKKAEYTYEELKAVHDNPHQLTADEMKNTFIEDDEKVDISKLKI